MSDLFPPLWLFRLVQLAIRGIAAPMLDWHVTGLEHIPRTGPVIAAFNHTSFLDVAVPAMFFPRPIVAFSKIEIYDSLFLGTAFRLMKMIPVRRGEVDRAALARARQVLDAGGAFGIAPEGTRTAGGCLIRAKQGVALLATASRAPIIPCALWGAAQRGFIRNLARLRRTRVEVVIGQPLRLKDLPRVQEREARQAIADDLMLHIAALLPEPMRGFYANPADFPERFFEPLEK